MGRTARRRKLRKKHDQNKADYHMELALLKSMNVKGFSSKGLRVSNFETTGRGMMALKAFFCGDILISLPRTLLIGVKQAFERSKWASDLAKFCSSISSTQLLCIFLAEGKHRLLKGDNFTWAPYIRSLPVKFDHHIFWPDNILELLPDSTLRKAKDIRKRVWKDFIRVEQSLPPQHEMKKMFSWSCYRWAWCCLNSRCIYSNHEKPPDWKFLGRSAADHYYLAPFLDMFNHSPSSKVHGSYNHATQSYEIKTLQKFEKYEQIFICYGAHTTENLFLEYGFISPDANINDVLPIPKSLLFKSCPKELCHSCMIVLNNFIVAHRLDEGWNVKDLEVSFNAQVSIYLRAILLGNCTGLPTQCNSHGKRNLAQILVMIQNDVVSQQIRAIARVSEESIITAMYCALDENFKKSLKLIGELPNQSREFSELRMVCHLFQVFLNNVSKEKLDTKSILNL